MIDKQNMWMTLLALAALAASAASSLGQQPVPQTSQVKPSFELVPVNPRDNSIWLQGSQPDTSDSLIDERTMSMLRSGKIEEVPEHSQPAEVETIRTRYPDGKVQILKNIIQDEMGNYYNHGAWRLFNQKGQILAEGQFNKGLMEGQWQRWHPANSDGLFSDEPFRQFQGPYLSSATFDRGEMDGIWIMYDKELRKILEIPYRQGKRHGTAIWWYPTATKMRQANFEEGKLDGSLKEWDRKNNIIRNDEYISGKRVIRNTSFYRPKQKEAEIFFLDMPMELDGDDNWWDAQPANFITRGEAIQHGPVSAWHDNGQIKMKGQYLNNEREGRFTWWHSNGQRSLTGEYAQGDKTGAWIWWHPNGMKQIEGNYQNDIESGTWNWWDDSGHVVTTENMTPAESTEELKKPVAPINLDSNSPLQSPLAPSQTEPQPLEEIPATKIDSNQPELLIPNINFKDDSFDDVLLEEPKRPDK